VKVVLTAILLTTALLSTVVPAPARELNKDYHESFAVHEDSRLHLVHGDGDVNITPWDKDMLDVKVRYHVKHEKIGLGGEAEFDVEFRQEGDTIHVIEHEKSVLVIGYSNMSQYNYTYTIQAPAYLELNIQGEDGNVAISGWQGEIRCSSDDGDFQLQDINSPRTELELEDGDLDIVDFSGTLEIAGDDGDVNLRRCQFPACRIRTEDGNVEVIECRGNFDIELDDGDVDIRRSAADEISIETADGDIQLHLDKAAELDLYAQTDDGDILIDLEQGTSAVFLIETEDGEILLDLPGAEIYTHDDEKAEGQIATGKGRIRIETADGTVRLQES